MAGYIGSKASVVSSGAERKKTFAITTTTTVLSGLSYTPTFVHLFHNGVRLVDGTDYTATDGTSITLTSAAESGDEVVVISYATFQTSDTVSASAGGTFTGDVSVTGAFTSKGIDDNATSTAMTLDTSGNVLVNKTTIDSNVQGLTLSGQYNLAAFTRDQNPPLLLNRLTNDGMIAEFRKDGTTVGSIGNHDASSMYIGSSDTGLRFNHVSDSLTPYNPLTGANRDAAVDLGYSSIRYKDLYLSGGVYLGGTGAANKLDDYEEGTWTPSSPDGAMQATNGGGNRYTKIGNLVYCEMDTRFFTSSSGVNTRIRGLPFTPLIYGTGNVGWSEFGVPTDIHIGTSDIYVMDNDTSRHLTYAQASGKRLIASFMFTTNS